MKKLFSVILLTVIALFIAKTTQAQDTNTTLFTYTHSAVIEVNKDFEHKLEVKLPTTMIPLEYVLLTGPEGMKIDKEKGIVTWKPITTGTFISEFAINFQGKKVGSAIIKLLVAEYVGSITGKITDVDGKPLPSALVTLHTKYSVPEKETYFTPTLRTESNANGEYTFPKVEEGVYVVSAGLKTDKGNPTITYPTVWYDNVSEIKLAKEIAITKTTPKFEINIALKKTVKVPDPPIIITYSNAFTLTLGEVFNYQVNEKLRIPAIQNPSYSFGKSPEGMTIDAATGKIAWTPTRGGEYFAEIYVKSGETQVAIEILSFSVVDFYGSVSGVVTNDEGKPLPGIAVTLYKKITVSQKNSYSSSYTGYTKADGSYTIEKVVGGEYYACARQALEKSNVRPTELYQTVWYLNAASIDKATPIKVADKNKVTVDFTMKKYVVPTSVVATVSGKVTNSELKPIANAYVIVTLANPPVNGSVVANSTVQCENYQSSVLGVFNNVAFKTVTDKEGNYKVSLPINNSYTFSSFAEGYNLQYYKETNNVLEAKKIELKTELTGIDFKLTALPVAKGMIGGKVVNSTGATVPSKVALITVRVDAQNNPIAISSTRSTNTDNNGEFVFEKVTNGSYYIQAIPLKEFMPAYYSSKECGVKEVKLAEQVIVKNEETIKGLLVCVKDIRVSGGGKISGKIIEANGNPLEGVVVFAESQNGDENSYAVSDANGLYEIADLSVGVYNVSADKLGYVATSTTNAVIDYAKNAFNASVNLTLPKNSTTDVETQNEIPAGYALNQNYPNPFNPETTISYQIPSAGFVTLKVYDVLGNEIAVLVNDYKQAGRFNITFNTRHLERSREMTSGLYFYRLTSGSYSEVKKMMLVK
ncbi:MAG: carboxypeptidase regulatory-like domain-containing protein [Melioribacteraceae bacterium]